MQFIDLKRQQERIKTEIDRRIQTVLSHGQYIMGPEVKEMENCLANYIGVKHCVGVANGSDALMIALMAIGVQPGDEVITSPFSFIATGEMIALLGAKPVFVDIDPNTYNIDSKKIPAVITSKTKAIIPVSLYGHCADFDAIQSALSQSAFKDSNIAVIEDGAQSFGAIYKGRKSCSLSIIGCTSFFPSKPLGCYGDGGACFTNDDELAKKMSQIRVHGQDKRYHHPVVGMNSRLDTLQAAIVLAKMTIFDEEIQRRQEIGNQYSELLKSKVKTPVVQNNCTHVYAQYTISTDNRETLLANLSSKRNDESIPTAVHYPIPLHLQPCFTQYGYKEGDFPVSENAAKTVLSLPMHPYLTEKEIIQVVESIK